MAFRAQRIDHVEVFVKDIDEAALWYRDVLGLEEVARWNPEPVMIGAGGTKLALFLASEHTRDAAPSSLRWHRVAWRTDRDGFRTAQTHLREHGIAFRGPVDHGIAQSVYFQDPDGHPLEITWYEEER